MPEGFEPKPETFAKAEAKGHSRQAVLEKAEGLFAWSRTKNEKRADWDLMILMGLGRDARASKPSTGPPRRGRSFLEIAEAADAYLRENHEPPDDELSSRPN